MSDLAMTPELMQMILDDEVAAGNIKLRSE